MKRKLLTVLLTLVTAFSLCLWPTGCGGLFGGDDTPKEYTIQYSDDAGTHTLTVTKGMPYSLESVPYKYGYEFLGLYDAQTGGTQYVGANGASLAPYTDKENKVLFPQFKPIDYTVILDYGNANVTGERSLTVAYNATLPELPKNLTLEHNEFTGWYTEAGGKGTQVADAYGNLPVVSVLNEENFKLDDSKRVYLYAGFELEKYTVTFIFDNGMPSEEMEVPYNTPISQVVPKTRNSEKQAGLTWSKSANGEVFNGNIREDIVLYVREWAPVIELNGNGADVTPIVAKAGTSISLPTPTKPLAKFLRWEDENGRERDITTMPAESTTLNAVWQAKIELDENGGSAVDDISKPAGESISLPVPTKEGYLFAGWYTAQKEQYTAKTMPSVGIVLKAGWYKEKSAVKNIITKDEQSGQYGDNLHIAKEFTIDLSDFLNEDFYGIVHLSVHFEYANGGATYSILAEWTFNLYSQPVLSDQYLLCANKFTNSGSWTKYGFEGEYMIGGNKIYVGVADKDIDRYFMSYSGHCRDYYVEINYPDTTYLYL